MSMEQNSTIPIKENYSMSKIRGRVEISLKIWPSMFPQEYYMIQYIQTNNLCIKSTCTL